MSTPPYNKDAEQSALGAVLLAQPALDALVVDVGLSAAHFYGDTHQRIFAAMLALADRGEPVDALTVSQVCPDDGGYIHSLANLVPSASNVRGYGQIVKDCALFRRKLEGARELQAAAAACDMAAVTSAEAALLATSDERGRAVTPAELASKVKARVDYGASHAWRLPWSSLTRRLSGGLSPGGVTLLGAWTSHGKSACANQIGVQVVNDEGTVRKALTTDMTAEEDGLRLVAHISRIPLSRLMVSDVREIERQDFEQALERLPFPILEAYGWSWQELAHDIRRHTPDLYILDMAHGVDYEGEADLRRGFKLLANAARETGTHLLATVHLNDARAADPLPPPVGRDIKHASSLRQDANNVLFMYRENRADSIKNEGRLYFSKIRGGTPGGINVEFDGPTMTISEVS